MGLEILLKLYFKNGNDGQNTLIIKLHDQQKKVFLFSNELKTMKENFIYERMTSCDFL